MKRTILAILIGISMVLSIGAASAITTVDVQIEKNNTIPCENISIPVVFDGNKITIGALILDPVHLETMTGYDMIGFNITPDVHPMYVKWTSLTHGDETADFVINPSGENGTTLIYPVPTSLFGTTLGEFSTGISLVTADGHRTRGPVEITFPVNVEPLANEMGYSVAVHLISVTTYDPDTGAITTGDSVKLGDGDCDGGNTTGNDIPEFPTIALPIAAIIGLAFVMQRRKE